MQTFANCISDKKKWLLLKVFPKDSILKQTFAFTCNYSLLQCISSFFCFATPLQFLQDLTALNVVTGGIPNTEPQYSAAPWLGTTGSVWDKYEFKVGLFTYAILKIQIFLCVSGKGWFLKGDWCASLLFLF
jgi:hypothetical protein